MLPKLTKLVLYGLLIGAGRYVSAQMRVDGQNVMASPQMWSFMKDGDQTPNLYTGTVRADIPIYTLSYQHDAANRLSGISDAFGNQRTKYVYGIQEY